MPYLPSAASVAEPSFSPHLANPVTASVRAGSAWPTAMLLSIMRINGRALGSSVDSISQSACTLALTIVADEARNHAH